MFNLLSFFTLPAATTTIAEASAYSAPWFIEFLPIVYISVGIFVGISLIPFLINIIKGAFYSLIGYFDKNYWLSDEHTQAFYDWRDKK